MSYIIIHTGNLYNYCIPIHQSVKKPKTKGESGKSASSTSKSATKRGLDTSEAELASKDQLKRMKLNAEPVWKQAKQAKSSQEVTGHTSAGGSATVVRGGGGAVGTEGESRIERANRLAR